MFSRSLNLFLALLFAVSLIGCGGGQRNSSSYGASGSGSPSSYDPAPSGSGSGGGGSGGTGGDVFSGSETASLAWTAPTTYEDGSPLTDLAGHNIYIDYGSGFVKIKTLNDPLQTDYMVTNLIPGTYTFAVTAFDSEGIESSYSNTATLTISII